MTCGHFSLSKLRQKCFIWTVFIFSKLLVFVVLIALMYTKHFSAWYLRETASFRKILGFEGLKSYFPPPVNVRNRLEGILSVIVKQRVKSYCNPCKYDRLLPHSSCLIKEFANRQKTNFTGGLLMNSTEYELLQYSKVTTNPYGVSFWGPRK